MGKVWDVHAGVWTAEEHSRHFQLPSFDWVWNSPKNDDRNHEKSAKLI